MPPPIGEVAFEKNADLLVQNKLTSFYIKNKTHFTAYCRHFYHLRFF